MNKPKIKTRKHAATTQFGSGASDLRTTEPCTLREVIQYSYFKQNKNNGMTIHRLSEDIYEDIKAVWIKVNPALPLLSKKSVVKKLTDNLTKVKSINQRKKISFKTFLEKKLDRLFDISACQCDLPDKVACSDR